SVASGSFNLSIREKRVIDNDKKELGDQFCRGCDYCQPCPQGIPISSVLRAESSIKRMGLTSRTERNLQEGFEKAGNCIECGVCETRCPYHLPIKELLKTKRKYISEILGTPI
ncbi:MAG: uncharacterized protein QG670_836, partial [Thermoproteota archaeon]|nr:uncharacterized protein [Thermoproteota archaeon]